RHLRHATCRSNMRQTRRIEQPRPPVIARWFTESAAVLQIPGSEDGPEPDTTQIQSITHEDHGQRDRHPLRERRKRGDEVLQIRYDHVDLSPGLTCPPNQLGLDVGPEMGGPIRHTRMRGPSKVDE